MKVVAPGKIILSGEHAVVYGKPALVMAVSRYVQVTVERASRRDVLLNLTNLTHQKYFSEASLKRLKAKIQNKYQRFLSGDINIRHVLRKPFELAHYALSSMAETLHHAMQHVEIKVDSDIPMGCGMGSSAATILSVLFALASFHELSLSKETLLQLALEVENAQHGKSSGIDLKICLEGGCLYTQNDITKKRPFSPDQFLFVNTGTPAATTGECVAQAATHFQSTTIADDFAASTNKIDQALANAALPKLYEGIAENHELLVKIGVVPKKVQDFIAKLQAQGAVAKVCGAGSVAGNAAGIVTILAADTSNIAALAADFNYEMLSMHCAMRGLHIV